ncbi:NAD(P)-dependent oxidoreductase [Pandoraea captiosa]|uniref:NAD(P)-dependent oxidoreductase n=1 Tax=Pandoraea captiosa TaxID=2508302 RepID=UPI003CCD0C13
MIRTALVVGASGATGRRLVHELLGRGWRVRAIVRSPAGLETLAADPRLTLMQGSVLDLSDEVLATQVDGCEALASCLGHNPTFRGIYGEPRRLVTETTRRLCQVIEARGRTLPVRFVLMNTAEFATGISPSRYRWHTDGPSAWCGRWYHRMRTTNRPPTFCAP